MIRQLISALALSKFDPPWSQTLKTSCLVSVVTNLIKRLMLQSGNLAAHFVPPASFASATTTAAVAAQFLSFIAALVLLAALPIPQFAADKEGLAVIAAVGIALYVSAKVLSTKGGTSTSTIDLLVLGTLFANIASAFASHYFQSSLTGLLKVLIYTLSYFWLSAVVTSRRGSSASATAVLLVSGLAVAVYGLYQYHIGVEPLATWEDPTVEQKVTRIYSTLGNPNLLAGYLTPLAPISAAVALMTLFKRHYLLSTITLAGCLVISTAIVLTGSRGAYIGLFSWVAFFLSVVCLYVLRTGSRLRLYLPLLLIGLICVAAVAAHFVPSFEQRVASIFAGAEHSSNAFRLNVWNASWRMFLDNWWLGIGPGNKTFILAYGLYMYSGFDALGTYCVPLEVAVETGIPGLIFFCTLVIALLARAHLTFQRTDSDFDRWLSLGCAAALVGMMVHGLVDTVFFRPQVQFIFWLVAALIASSYRRMSTRTSAQMSTGSSGI